MTEGFEQDGYEFDVAMSFAGEDREFVEKVVEPLKKAGVRVFYDSDYMADTWGENLVEYLDEIYRVKARYAIIFVSQRYAAKMWTRHERRSAVARGLQQSSAYVLPVRLDDTNLPGLLPTVGYLDARHVGLDGIVQAALKKLSLADHATASAITRAPRTEVERQQVLLDRPTGWEILCLAGQMLHERNNIESKYRDHEIRYSPLRGESLTRETLASYISAAATEAAHLSDSIMRVMASNAVERAFGPPGQDGDPDRIIHLAKRMNSVYEGFMDWAARVRSVSAPSEFHHVLELLAQLVDGPVHTYREFVDELVAQADQIPAAVAKGEAPREVTMTFVLEIPDEATEAFNAELERVMSA
jgi:hypothetical protein